MVLNNFEFDPTLDCSAPPFFRCTCQPGPGACTYLVCEDPYGQAGCPSGTPPVSPPVSPAVTPAPEPVTPSPPTPVSSSCEPDWIGNGYCDESELPSSVFGGLLFVYDRQCTKEDKRLETESHLFVTRGVAVACFTRNTC